MKKAAAAFEDAIRVNPADTEAARHLARCYELLRGWSKAIDVYTGLLAQSNRSDWTQIYLAARAECYRQAGCNHHALEDYSEALRIVPPEGEGSPHPQYLFALAGKAETLRMMGRTTEALEWFDAALAVNPEHAFAVRGKAATLNRMGRYEEALPIWEAAVSLDPSSEFSQQGLREAQNPSPKTVTMEPAVLEGERLQAEKLYQWGKALTAERRFKDASEAYEGALELEPSWTECAAELALTLERGRRWDDALRAYDRVLALDPTRVQAASNQGEVLRKAERFDEAITAYDRALQLEPGYVFALAGRAEALRMLGRYEAALTWYAKALSRKPTHAFALRGKAAALNALRRFDEALPIWEQALTMDPSSEFAVAGRAFCRSERTKEDGAHSSLIPHTDPRSSFLEEARALLRQGRHTDAIEMLRPRVDADSTAVEPRLLLGAALAAERRYRRAIEIFEDVLKLSPHHVEAAIARGDALRKNNDYQTAVEAYDAILSRIPNDVRALTGRAESLRMLGEFEEALLWFDRALSQSHDFFLAVCGKAACLNALGRYESAMPLWEHALRENPEAVFVRRGLENCRRALGGSTDPDVQPATPLSPTRERAMAVMQKGRTLYKSREYRSAVRMFRSALSIDPTFGEAALRLGMAYEDDQQYDLAIEAYKRALTLSPAHYQAATNIGEALRKSKRWDEAIVAYDHALKMRPSYLYALAGRADCLRMMTQFDESLIWYDKALSEEPRHAFALQGKAAALNALNRFKEAMDYWDSALEIDPQSQFALDGRSACSTALKAAEEPESATPTIDEQGRDLTKLAHEGLLSRVIGREAEIRQVMKTLIRRLKANPLLLGEPGVGKTAVIEGVAQRLAADDAPERLKHLRIIELSMGSMIAGTKYRGTFEQRLREIVKECADNPEIVLFIDEIHTLVGAGRTEGGSLDAANILKPSLARGTIHLIGATTEEEYKRHFEPDSALERRFQPIHIKEPTRDDTIQLLSAIASDYEDHHSVKVTTDAIEACVSLSVRYIPNRRLPDKALDLLDEACADASLAGSAHVDAARVATVLAERTGVPVAQIDAEERSRLLAMKSSLQQRVVGQDDAIDQLVSAVQMARSGLRDHARPRGVFLFVGESGVGKTELAKSLAEFLFPKEDALIRLDMSEYSERFTSSRLLGVPPGYSGHGEEGQLTGPLRTNPYSIVLLDEFEKAHPDVQTLFLSLFDDGVVTDAEGRRVMAREAFFVLTTNAGSDASTKARMGFGSETPAAKRQAALEQLSKHFRPELLNRIDDIIVFNKLCKADRLSIAGMHLSRLQDRAQSQGVMLSWDRSVEVFVAEHNRHTAGARAVIRAIDELVAEPLSRRMVAGDASHHIHATTQGDTIVLNEQLSAGIQEQVDDPALA